MRQRMARGRGSRLGPQRDGASDLIVRGARLPDGAGPLDIGVADGRIVALAPALGTNAPTLDAGGRLVVPGLVETHIHLDKTCILDRCPTAEGSVAEAVRLTAQAKRGFTPADVYARGRRTLERASGWGGRVAVGHVTQMSLVPPGHFAATLARAGVAVTVLPATDLYLMGRAHDHAVPRGVVTAEPLRAAGVTCSVSTNNVLNPFTPYGGANPPRMANLCANVCHVARPGDPAACLGMVTTDAARLMRLPDYGFRVGAAADLVLLDTTDPAGAVAELAQPLWGMRRGRMTFTRQRPVLHLPAEGTA